MLFLPSALTRALQPGPAYPRAGRSASKLRVRAYGSCLRERMSTFIMCIPFCSRVDIESARRQGGGGKVERGRREKIGEGGDCNQECAKEYLWLRCSGEELMNSIIVRLWQRARSQRGWLALQSLPSLLPCLPAGRGRRRGRSGRGRARRAMQMSGGDGQLRFPMSLRNSSAPSLNSSLQTLYFPQNTGSQALGELAGSRGELHMQQPLF